MENPCLTFVTPCLLAGDRSLADVIIHEISHSWFGNLVTNANWGEFWLNEGFTMYAQRRISTVLFGKVMSSWHLAPFFSQCPPLGIQATGVCEGRK
jgi:aminopeptidase N